MGVFVSASYRHIEDVADNWLIQGGLTFRLLASVGILICWFLIYWFPI